MITLDKLEIGQSASIKSVGGEGQRRQHFLDMGVIPEAIIKLVKYAPLGDPMEVLIHGYSLTLRKTDARLIGVELCHNTCNRSFPLFSILFPSSQTHGSFSNKIYTESCQQDKTQNRLPSSHHCLRKMFYQLSIDVLCGIIQL